MNIHIHDLTLHASKTEPTIITIMNNINSFGWCMQHRKTTHILKHMGARLLEVINNSIHSQKLNLVKAERHTSDEVVTVPDDQSTIGKQMCLWGDQQSI